MVKMFFDLCFLHDLRFVLKKNRNSHTQCQSTTRIRKKSKQPDQQKALNKALRQTKKKAVLTKKKHVNLKTNQKSCQAIIKRSVSCGSQKISKHIWMIDWKVIRIRIRIRHKTNKMIRNKLRRIQMNTKIPVRSTKNYKLQWLKCSLIYVFCMIYVLY